MVVTATVAAVKTRNQCGNRVRKKWKTAKKVYNPDPTCNKYCNFHGVQADHENGNCPNKEKKYWQAGITFNNRRAGCCKKNLHKWHLGVKGQPVNYN